MSELMIFRERGQSTSAMLRSSLCSMEASDDGKEKRMRPPPPPTPAVVDVKRLDHLPLVGALLRKLDVKETLDALIPPPARHDVPVGACVEVVGLVMLIGEQAWSRGAER
jgi:hypothetical protein